MSSSLNQRRYFRLNYPTVLMPTAVINGIEYVVPEISEGGIRIRCKEPFEFQLGCEVDGELLFKDGDGVNISGIVFRRFNDGYVIAPLQGLSFRRIITEQRKILRKFPSTNVVSEDVAEANS